MTSVDDLIEEGNRCAYYLTAIVLVKDHICVVSARYPMELTQWVLANQRKVLNIVIADDAVLRRDQIADWLGRLGRRGACNLLLFDPKSGRCRREEGDIARVLENLLVPRSVVGIHVLELAHEDVVWLHVGKWDQVFVGLVQPFGEETVVGCKKDDAREHSLSNYRVGHVSGKEATEGSTEEEDGRALLIDFELLDSLKDHGPAVAIDLLGTQEDATLALRVSMPTHVEGENFVTVLGKELGHDSHLRCTRPVTMDHKDYALAFMDSWPPVRHQLDFLAIVSNSEVHRVDFRKFETAEVVALNWCKLRLVRLPVV